ncbi:hypothetical protein [Paenibacillus sp. RU26A]|nr:hypothetical protein [Paenibacillus sp. RU26A]
MRSSSSAIGSGVNFGGMFLSGALSLRHRVPVMNDNSAYSFRHSLYE